MWHLKSYITTENDPGSEDESPPASDNEADRLSRMKTKPKGKKAKNKEVNPTKQRIWNLDALRVNDMLAMKNIKSQLMKHRKKIEPKNAGAAAK
jgi:hypothetical protein